MHGRLTDLRGGRGGGRREDAIDLGPQFRKLADLDAAEALNIGVIGGGDQTALVEQSQNVGAEIGAAVEIGAQVGDGFDQQKDSPDYVDGVDVGDFDVDDARSQGGGGLHGVADGGGDFRVQTIQVIILRQADAKVLDVDLFRRDVGGG